MKRIEMGAHLAGKKAEAEKAYAEAVRPFWAVLDERQREIFPTLVGKHRPRR
jgi:hypothetical protein